jgi:hypothetical protein
MRLGRESSMELFGEGVEVDELGLWVRRARRLRREGGRSRSRRREGGRESFVWSCDVGVEDENLTSRASGRDGRPGELIPVRGGLGREGGREGV